MKIMNKIVFSLILGIISSAQAVAQPSALFNKNPNYDVLKVIGCWSKSDSAEGDYPTIRLTGKAKTNMNIFSVQAWFIRDGDKSMGDGYGSSGGIPKDIITTLDARGSLGYTYGYSKNSKVVAKLMIKFSSLKKSGYYDQGDVYATASIPIQNKDCPNLGSD